MPVRCLIILIIAVKKFEVIGYFIRYPNGMPKPVNDTLQNVKEK
jgi:hypothetical protein